MRRRWVAVGLVAFLMTGIAYAQSRFQGGQQRGGQFGGAQNPTYTNTATATVTNTGGGPTATPTATPPPFVPPQVNPNTPIPFKAPHVIESTPIPFLPGKISFNSPTIAPSPTATDIFTVTATFTATPTIHQQPECVWQTFTVAASGDDATLTKVDFANGWPPAGGTPVPDVTGDGDMTVLVQGASNTQGTYCALVGPAVSAPCIPWPFVMLRDADPNWNAGGGSVEWHVRNLAVNNQSTMDYRAINNGFVPWMGDEDHSTVGIPDRCFVYSPNTNNFCATSGLFCTSTADCPAGGATGQASDAVAVDPDVVIYGAEANDARYPYQTFSCLPPGPTVPYDPCSSGTFGPLDKSDPQEYIDQVLAFCNEVHAHNANIFCLYTTMHLQAYVGQVPWTRNWIEELNTKLRQQIPADHLVDFDTNSTQVVDLMMPHYFDNSHAWQRLYTARGQRSAAWLKKSFVDKTGPSVMAETSRWNGVNMRSIGAVRFDMASGIPDGYEPLKAYLEIGVQYIGAQYGQQSTGGTTGTIDIEWANSQANNGGGWTIADYPTSLTGDAYSGSLPVATPARRSYSTGPGGAIISDRYTFALDKPNSLTANNRTGAYAGLFLEISPDTQPPTDTYLTANFVSYDDPHSAIKPKLHVYSCKVPHVPDIRVREQRVAVVPVGHVAVVEGIGDVKICDATPTPGTIGTGSNYICANTKANPRGYASAQIGVPIEIPDLGDSIIKCSPGEPYTHFLCRTTPTPGSVRAKIGESGKPVQYDAWTDWGMCDATSQHYLCVIP